MKVAIYEQKGRIAWREIPLPVPAADEVLIRITACGICGSDIHRIFSDDAVPGVVLGHEWVGVVEAIGDKVTRVRVGDRVVPGGGNGVRPAVPYDSPHTPPSAVQVGGVQGARARHSPRDNGRNCFPGTYAQGGFAEYTLRQEYSLGVVPPTMSDFAAASCEPLAVAIQAVRQSGVMLGDTVAVFGAGPIGLFVLQAARLQGATRIIVVDPESHRRELASRLGADHVVDPGCENALDAVVALAGNDGPDVAFECAGAPPTLQQALECVTWEGRVVLVAVRWQDTPVVPVEWLARQPQLRVSYAYGARGWPTAIKLLQDGRVSIDGMIDSGHIYPLENLQTALDACVKREAGVIKAMILPGKQEQAS